MGQWLSLPNLITYVRFALVPLSARAILTERYGTALGLFVAAGLSDAVDGLLARRFHWQTRWGAYLDPVADKLLMGVNYVVLAAVGRLPWWLTCLVLGRDALILLLAGAAMLAAGKRDFPPSRWGKLSTTFQITTAATVLGDGTWPGLGLGPAVAGLLWLTAAATAGSGLHYLFTGLRRRR